MKTLDIESKGLTLEEAEKQLNSFIIEMKRKKVVIAKVIHGYGSRDHGIGKIRLKVEKRLNNLTKRKEIIGYIPGDFQTNKKINFSDLKAKYSKYLREDSAHLHDNEGITYICFFEPK